MEGHRSTDKATGDNRLISPKSHIDGEVCTSMSARRILELWFKGWAVP